ncbi:unnamed protein product, partial [Prorocentrum cordatum]
DMDTALARGFPELHYDPDDDDDAPWDSSSWASVAATGRRISNGGLSSRRNSLSSTGSRRLSGAGLGRRPSLAEQLGSLVAPATGRRGSRRSTNNNTLLAGGNAASQWRPGVRGGSKNAAPGQQGSQWTVTVPESKVFQLVPFFGRVSSTRTSTASSGALSGGPLRTHGQLLGAFAGSPAGSKSPPASPAAVSAPVLPVEPHVHVRDPHVPLEGDRCAP